MTLIQTEATARGVTVGAGMRNWNVFSGTAGLQALTAANFGLLMPGNAFKWVNTEPTQGGFSFVEADLFVDWANSRSMPWRLHTLVWHNSLASWVSAAVNSGTWQGIIDTHASGVLGHYPGITSDIDVVNEAFRPEDGQAGGFRNTLWYQAAGGSDYVPYAFERARIHAPDARLFLAEFGIEQAGQDTKRANLLAAVEDWLSQDVPIDGIAIQAHLQASLSLDKPALRSFINDLTVLGLTIQVTELDFRGISALGLSDAGAFEFIGAYTQDFVTTVINAGVQTVVAWGVTPADWAATPTEQIAAVPFDASLNLTSVGNGLILAFRGGAAVASTRDRAFLAAEGGVKSRVGLVPLQDFVGDVIGFGSDELAYGSDYVGYA